MELPFSKRGARPRTGLNIAFCTALEPQTRNGTRQPLLSRFSWCFVHAHKPHREQPNAEKARFQARQKHRLGQAQRRNGGGSDSLYTKQQASEDARSTDLAKAKGETERGAAACTPNTGARKHMDTQIQTETSLMQTKA